MFLHPIKTVCYTYSDIVALLQNPDNIVKYNIDKADALKICNQYGIYTSWLDNYRDRTEADGDVEIDDDKTISWKYAGMVKK